MSAGKVWALINTVLLVGLLGAGIANGDLWGAFAVAVAVSFVFWLGYSMGYEDAENAR
jgi:hypothetical protein